VNFEIENNFDLTHTKEDKGIGLQNLKRRLELVYPKKHTLTFIVKEDVYNAKLTLQV
jgi:LytS/YehU family sensor histidine kinase